MRRPPTAANQHLDIDAAEPSAPEQLSRDGLDFRLVAVDLRQRLRPAVVKALSGALPAARTARGACEHENSVGGPLFGSLSKTASSVAREASPGSAAGSRRVLDPDLASIARPLGSDLEAGLGCNGIGPQPQGQSVYHPAHALRRAQFTETTACPSGTLVMSAYSGGSRPAIPE